MEIIRNLPNIFFWKKYDLGHKVKKKYRKKNVQTPPETDSAQKNRKNTTRFLPTSFRALVRTYCLHGIKRQADNFFHVNQLKTTNSKFLVLNSAFGRWKWLIKAYHIMIIPYISTLADKTFKQASPQTQ